MPTISLDTLFANLPEIDVADGYVLLLEIELNHLTAQIYQKVETGYKPHNIEKSQQYTSEYNILTASFNDPLLEDILLKFGLYWENYNRLDLSHIIERLTPIFHDFVEALMQNYEIQYTMLVGSLSNNLTVVNIVKALVDDDARLHWAQEYTTWKLPNMERLLQQTLVTSATIDGYYDLLAIQEGVTSLDWVRVPLLGKDRPLKRENLTLHFPFNTNRCYFFIARFNHRNDYATVDVQQHLRSEQIYRAFDIDVSRHETLTYNISLNPETEMISASFEDTTAQDIHTNPYSVLIEQSRKVQLRAAPMQVVFLVDGTLVDSKYERCRQIIADIVQNQPDKYYWLLFNVGDNVISPVMNKYFIATSKFIHELANVKYDDNALYLPMENKLRFNRAFDEILKLDWMQMHSNYYVLFTDRQSQTNMQSSSERLKQKGISGLGVWLASNDLFKSDDPKLQELSVLGEWCISHLDSSKGDGQYQQARDFLLERLLPVTANALNLDGIPLPIVQNNV